MMMCANFEPEKFLERMAERDVFAATLGDEFAGTVSFSLPRSKLYSLFIEPRVQRSGTGQRLVADVEDAVEIQQDSAHVSIMRSQRDVVHSRGRQACPLRAGRPLSRPRAAVSHRCGAQGGASPCVRRQRDQALSAGHGIVPHTRRG